MPSEWRNIRATEPKVASGLAMPWPAMSGAEPCTGSYRPGPPSPETGRGQQADRAGDHRGLVREDVAEHVLGQDHVEVGRPRYQLHGRVVDQHVLERDARVVRRDALDHLAPEARRLEDVGLVDRGDAAGSRRRRRDLEGQPRDPLDLVLRVDAGVEGARLVAPALAEVDAAGQLPDDQQVGAGDALVAQRARRDQRVADANRAAGWRTARAPCAAPAGPARVAARPGRSCPTWGRRPRRAGPRPPSGSGRARRRAAARRARRSRCRRPAAR